MIENEEMLDGGNVNDVVRIGNTVHRTADNAFVHELLMFLKKCGFCKVPEFLGIDDKGREILSFLPGEVPGNDYPDFKPYIWTENSLIRCAELLRQYHDAVQDFTPFAEKYDFNNNYSLMEGWVNEVVCHNDAALYNVVFRNEVPVALIDFDLAAPGPRIWDIVYMLYTAVPLASFAIDYTTGKSISYNHNLHAADRCKRISLFFKSYGIALPQNLKEWTIRRIKGMCDTLTLGAEQGNHAFQKMIDEGHLTHYQQEIIFLKEHFEEWLYKC